MKKSLKISLLTFLLLYNSNLLLSQETRIEIGDRYYEMKAFEKAIPFYENTNNQNRIHAKLGDCYYYTSQPQKAVVQYDHAFPNIEKSRDSRDFKKHRLKYALCLLSVWQQTKLDSIPLKMNSIQYKNNKEKLDNAKLIFSDIYGIKVDSLKTRTVDVTLMDLAENLSINSPNSDFGAYIFNDFLYFASSREKDKKRRHNKALYKWTEHPFLEIYRAAINRDESPNTINFNPTDSSSIVFNTPAHEASLAFIDSNTMIFSGGEVNKKGKKAYKRGVSNLKLQIAKRNNDQWDVHEESTKLLDFLNLDNYSVGNPALSPENKRLFFVSCAPYPKAMGQSDIYYVDMVNGIPSGKVNSVPGINTNGRESFPFISADGDLYFSSDGFYNNELGLGLLDIYKVDNINEYIVYSEKINSEFAGEEQKIKRELEKKIKHLKTPFNSPKDDFAFFMEPKDIYDSERYAYFSSNREHPDAQCDDDIYRAKIKLSKTIQVSVMDSITEEPLKNALIELIDSDDNVMKVKTDSLGLSSFEVEPNGFYSLKTSMAMYYDNYYEIDSIGIEDNINLKLKPYQCVYNIVFDLELGTDISFDAKVVLLPLLELLWTNLDIEIIIEAHTDSVGSREDNQKLSEKRALESKLYLVGAGIDESRISTVGYGEDYPIRSDEVINSLPIEDHESARLKNRRSIFIIKNCDN